LVLAGACLAQQRSFRYYGAAEGLQNLAILSIAQDAQGFLWTGTESGLYRYDGTRFHLMDAAEGLPCTAEVHGLYAAPDGAVWANTCSKLFRFDGRRFAEAAGIGGMLNRAQAIAGGTGGRVVVSTGSGLKEVGPDGPDGSLVARPYLPGQPAAAHKTRGVFRSGGQLWFGCDVQLCVEENGRVTEFGEREGLPQDSWDAVIVLADGSVWARSTGKLYAKPAGAARFRQAPFEIGPSMYWGALAAGPDGTLLVPSDAGVAVRERGRWSLLDETKGLRSSMIAAALIDRQGSLWVGLTGGGLARLLGGGQWEGWTKAQGLASNLVWSILRDRRGGLWVGTSAGLTRLEAGRATRTWTKSDGLGGENVRWLGEARDAAIWSLTKPGWLVRIDPATGRLRALGKKDGLAASMLYRGFVDRSGRIWIAADTGLFRDDDPAVTFRFAKVNPPGIMTSGAWAVAQDGEGTFWITGPDGLWRLKGSEWRHYGKAEGLLIENPYITVVGPDGALWIRHRYDDGIERVEFAGDRIARATAIVPTAAGTGVTAFHGFDAQGAFWRGTDKGVQVLGRGSWTQYSTEDGLLWDDCDGEAFWADSDRSVWIGTSGGLAHFRPRPEAGASVRADPIVSSLEIRRQPRLARVSFSSLDFLHEQLMRFSYRLDGGPWTDAAERAISIDGIGPGRRRIEVRSQVRNGPFSEKLAVAEFRVPPFWWESWWFRGLVAAALGAVVYAGVLWRNRTLRRRNLALERAVRERTAELEAERAKVVEEKRRADEASEAKGRFLANMSHEIRTPLNGLLGLAGLMEGIQDPKESLETVRLIRSSGQMLLAMINDILDFSKVEAGKAELDHAPF